MTQVPAGDEVLSASRDELVAMQLQLASGSGDSADADSSIANAIALCLEADLALVALLSRAQPQEPAEVIIAQYRRRWKGRLIGCGVVGPLALVGLVLLGVVIVTLVTAFVWRP